MAVAKEIYDSLVLEFPASMQPITLLSRNEQGNKNFVISDVKAFNFDNVHCYSSASIEKEKSPDVLFFYNDTLYLVEFKEGKCDKADIRQKIHEGILTLYHYARARKLATRDSFFDVKIKYAVIKRPAKNKGSEFLKLLEESIDFFHLKNMDGWLLEGTTVIWKAESILKLLNKISNDSVRSIDILSTDQAANETISI